MSSMMSPIDLMPSGIERENGIMVAITTLFTFLATVAVILRFISRRISMTVEWDDWFSLIALIFAYGCFIATLLAATIGHGGYDIEYYSAATLEKYLGVTLAENVLYAASISFSKAAVLLLFHRIFKIQKSFRISSWIVGFFIAGYFISSQFLLIFAYSPTEAQWKPWLAHSANFNVIASWKVMSIINMVVDFMILCLPQPVVWRLKMNLKKKVLLSGLFCFGIVICIADLMHIICISEVDINNPTATEASTAIWQNVELNLSVIVTCLPTFPSLISHFRNGPRSASRSYEKSDDTDYKKPLNDGSFPQAGTGNTTSFSGGQHLANSESMDKTFRDSSYSMDHMGPVHVQTDIRVKWDGESHHSGSIV